jgi:hypothetical protein
MKLLDFDPLVSMYDYEALSVPYTIDGQVKLYVIDFKVEYVDGTIKLIEVKPECFMKEEINQIKEQAGKLFANDNKFEYATYVEGDLDDYKNSLRFLSSLG